MLHAILLCCDMTVLCKVLPRLQRAVLQLLELLGVIGHGEHPAHTSQPVLIVLCFICKGSCCFVLYMQTVLIISVFATVLIISALCKLSLLLVLVCCAEIKSLLFSDLNAKYPYYAVPSTLISEPQPWTKLDILSTRFMG